MDRIIKSRAIVLKGQDLGESNRIITLFTKEQGKLKAVARGAKRSKRRFQNALEDLTLSKVNLKAPRVGSLFHLDFIESIDTFYELRMDARKYACAALASELADLWTKELSPEKELFELLIWYLRRLKLERDPFPVTLYFKIKILKISGYGPKWESLDEKGLKVSKGTLRCLNFVQASPLDSIQRLRMSRQNMKEAWGLLKALHIRYLEIEPRSYKVLREIART